MMRTLFPSAFKWLALAAFLAASATHARDVRDPREIARFDETTLARDAVTFQRGAFRVDESGAVHVLCVPTDGQWRQAGTRKDCGASPPPEARRENAKPIPDQTVLIIRHLGVDSAQWKQVEAARRSGPAEGTYRRIAEAFEYTISPEDTRWHLRTRFLPEQLKADIPGAGINIHLGGAFSAGRKPLLFDEAMHGIELEAQLQLPVFRHSGRTHSGLSMAIDLEVPSRDGGVSNVPLIVNILHPNPRGKEVIASDGRNRFVGSFLGGGTRYVEALSGAQQSGEWSGMRKFSFRVTRGNLINLINDLNRKGGGREALDPDAIAKVAVSSVTLRNESRFLDQGDLEIEVVVDYLKLLRAK